MDTAVHLMWHTHAKADAGRRAAPVSPAYDSDVLPRVTRMSAKPSTFLFALGLTTAIYTVTNNAISTSLFSDNVPFSVVGIAFCALLFWFIVLHDAISWVVVHGRISGGEVEQVVSREISFVTTLLSGAFVTITISVLLKGLAVWSLGPVTQVVFVVTYIFVVIAAFASLGFNL